MKLRVRGTVATLMMLSALSVSADADAFLIGTHRSITENALARLPETALANPIEREKLANGSVETDLVEGDLFRTDAYDGRYHFDSLDSYTAVQNNFRQMVQLAQDHVGKQLRDPWAFGKILHAVQDFYAHSNYIPLFREYRASRKEPVASIPTLEEALLQPARYPGFEQVLSRLRTGYYPNRSTLPSPVDHGWMIGIGLNNDNLVRRFYREAMETAERATHFYILLYLDDRGAWERAAKIWGPLNTGDK